MIRIKPVLPKSLFWRTFFILLLPVLLAQVTTTYVFFDRHWSRMTDRLAQGVTGEIATLRDILEKYGDATDSVLLEDIQKLYAEKMGLQYVYKQNVQIGLTNTKNKNALEIDANLKSALDIHVERPYTVSVDRKTKTVFVTMQLKTGLLTILLPQNRLYDSSAVIFVLWLNCLALLFFAVSILFMRNQIRPIRKLALAADAFGRGGAMVDLKPTGAREVRQAAESFLNMQARIKRQIHQRTHMLAGVSHDMRTPLTRMKLQLALLDETPDTLALKEDIQAMERMIDSYLSFARDAADEPVQTLDVVQLIKRVLADQTRSGLTAQVTMPESLRLNLRPLAFERALSNVLDNARLHGAPPYFLSLQVDIQTDQILLVIEDSGAGIPDGKIDDVLKPFVRLVGSMQPSTGIGLGLSIVQDVVLAHGGRLELRRAKSGGLRVEIHLPASLVKNESV